jgi:hypothetical protein
VSTSTSHGVAARGLATQPAAPVAEPADTAGGPGTAVVRRSSVQPTRRAVLDVQAPDDPVAPPELANWYTERAFHYYVAALRLPHAARLVVRQPGRRAGRELRDAFADLDAACARVRASDGMASVIVTARGRAAVAAALWADSAQCGADALILSAPAWPRGGLRLTIGCPVLVLTNESSQAPSRPWQPRTRGLGPQPPQPPQLGSHVTWLTLAGTGGDQRLHLAELGRWLGAYMYGTGPDQLL